MMLSDKHFKFCFGPSSSLTTFVTQITITLHVLGLHSISSVELEIVSILPYNQAAATSVTLTGAAFLVAAERANNLDNGASSNVNVSIKFIYDKSHVTCNDILADSPRLLAEYYYQTSNWKRCLVIVGSNCNDIPGICGLAKQWNVMVLSNGLSGLEFLNKRICPTGLAMAGAFTDFSNALIRLLEYNKWHHVSLLLDTKATTPVYGALSTIVYTALKMLNDTFQPDIFTFSLDSKESVYKALQRAKERSRILVLLCSAEATMKLMLLGKTNLAMGNGEYVFLNMQPTQHKFYGKISQFENISDSDMPTFRSLLFITSHSLGGELADLNQEISNLSKALYNTTDADGILPFNLYSSRASYDIVDVLVKLLNESGNNPEKAVCNAARLVRQSLNRTFEITSGSVFVSDDGARRLDLDIFGYDSTNRSMKVFAFFNSTTQELHWERNLLKDWPEPGGMPPSDVPLCGYSGAEGVLCTQTERSLATVILSTTAGFLLVITLVFIILTRNAFVVSKNATVWVVPSRELVVDTSSARNGSSDKARWKNKSVWIAVVNTCHKPDYSTAKKLAQSLILLDHENLNSFYGLCVFTDYVYFVSGFCKHGSLLDLFQEISLDWDFKTSLLNDLIQGLTYIYYSSLGVHGSLRLKKCLIDPRFGLKIAKIGFDDLSKCLLKFSGKKWRRNIWTPPESNSRHSATREADIFAFGLLAATVVQQEEPMLMDGVASFCNQLPACPRELQTLILQCVDDDPRMRPTIKRVSARFVHLEKRTTKAGQSLIEKVLARFSVYTATLENAIDERTESLKLERKNCDKLLEQILPGFIVEKLRVNITPEAEFYGSVTIYFSDLDGFVNWVLMASPYQTITLLNTVYNLFDGEISNFLVQKIETVGDCYMVVSGIPLCKPLSHAAEICSMALSLMDKFLKQKDVSALLKLRVGIHSGACAAGVIGTKVPRYCLFGDMVNVASRMETYGEGSKVHVSSATAALISGDSQFYCNERGILEIKGKGKMRTFWICRNDLFNSTV